jgi:3-oxoadipate enol-lactonase
MTAITLHSTIGGPKDAPVLLLLNSLGATTRMWDPQIDLLRSRYRTITFDTRGHGQSPSPESPYRFKDLVADALAVLDAYGVEKASVMGLSLGGMTALGLGLTAPDRIDRVVCCTGRADAPQAFVQSWVDRLAVLKTGGMAQLWEGTVSRWLSDDTRKDHPEREELLHQEFMKTTATGYCGCAEALKRLDYLQYLGAMTRPTLFLAGGNDVGATPHTMQAMAAACPTGSYVEVPDARHIANMDRPAAFNTAIAGFVGLDAVGC